MTEPDAPVPRVRASDAERDEVAAVVRRAVGDGRLTLAEGDERLAQVYAAVHRDQLSTVTRDLQEAPPTPRPTPRAPAAGLVTSSSFALMSGKTRRGAWSPGPEHSAAAVMGGVELDLREARLDPGGTTIRAVALMGGVVIIVGPDVEVVCDGVGIMGGFADQTGPPTTPPAVGTPPLRVVGLAFWGGVEIRRKGREELPPGS